MNCYNGEKFLTRSLKSVIDQKYQNFELIFWDNLSNDKSKEIFQKFKDKRFKYFVAKKHKALYDARNDALKICKGKYISFLDTDDSWLSHKLSSQISIMEQSSNVGLVYGNYIKYNKNKFLLKKKSVNPKYFRSGKITEYLIENYFIGLLTVLIRKDFMKGDLEFFNSKYNLLSDFDYILKFSKKHEIRYVKDNIAIYHQHDNQLQKKYIEKQADQFTDWFETNLKTKNLFEKNYNLINIKNKIKFLNLASKILKKKRISHLRDIFFFPNTLFKIKLILIFFLPEKIHKKFLSFT